MYQTFSGANSASSFAGDGLSSSVSYAGLSGGIVLSFSNGSSATVAKPFLADGSTTDTLSGITSVLGTGFDDSLSGSAAYVRGGVSLLLTGGAGNDHLYGFNQAWNVADYGTSQTGITANLGTGMVADGLGGTDTLTGIVSLRGSANADTITGAGSGAWTTLEGMGGDDLIDGKGLLLNGVSYANSTGGVVVDLGAGFASDGMGGTDTLVNLVRVIGSAHDDVITGSAGNDWIHASYGTDLIDGTGGVNTLDYGMLGGSVQVTLTGDRAGTATKYWGSDQFSDIDVVQGSYGSDRLTGWAEATKTVYLRGMIGSDTIDGAGNAHNIADYAGTTTPITLNLATGQALGTIGTDTLVNVLAVRGGNGNDTIVSSAEHNFTVDGGGGNDTLDYRGLGSYVSVVFNPTSFATGLSGTALKSSGGDSFTNIGTVLGTRYNDHLVGSTSTSTTGIDGIRLDGEQGNDVIDGKGSSLNRADYTDSPNAVVVQLQTSGNAAAWHGTASDGWGTTDVLDNVSGVYGSAFADSIIGSNQDDAIAGWYGNDTIDGGLGIDTALYWTTQSNATWAKTMVGGAWDGSWTVTSAYGTDILRRVEQLQFKDGLVVLNHAPTSISVAPNTVYENAAGAVIGTLVTTDADAGEQFTYTVSSSKFEVVSGSILKLKDGISLDYEQTPNVTVNVTTTDIGGLSVSKSVLVAVNNVNEAPVVAAKVPTLFFQSGVAASYNATGAFTDPDQGDSITWSAKLANGSALPSWLSFNPSTHVVSVSTGATSGVTGVTLTATDSHGLATSTSFSVASTGTAGATTTASTGDNLLDYRASAAKTVDALAGNDFVFGSAYGDSLNGNLGNDTLVGGAGSDTLTSGSTGDGDSFWYNEASSGADIITDFTRGLDHVGFFASTTGVKSFADLTIGSTQVGGVTLEVISWSNAVGAGSITFGGAAAGLTAAQGAINIGANVLTASDFNFYA